MQSRQLLANTLEQLVATGKGILAADESLTTIGKRFSDIGIENTEEHRRDYRTLLATTEKLEEYISGVILFEETLEQKTKDGRAIAQLFANKGIIPGIKVDKGLIALEPDSNEKTTQGLDQLGERLADYQAKGARFAKWRCVYTISDNTPTEVLLHTNAELLARYAHICQCLGVVPIVEPEVLMDGAHDLERAAVVTEKVLTQVFAALSRYNVQLEYMILKPNMVVPGKGGKKADPLEVANATLKVFARTVPAAVPSINFLSGGQSPEEATANLNAMNKTKQPWNLSFSYGRALQEPCLQAWKGEVNNVAQAQAALLQCAKLNSLAVEGKA